MDSICLDLKEEEPWGVLPLLSPKMKKGLFLREHPIMDSSLSAIGQPGLQTRPGARTIQSFPTGINRDVSDPWSPWTYCQATRV